jgi:hypothetical protein
MGLGKSMQLIRASEGRTLVVAPAMVLEGGTWDDEIAKWADDPSRFSQVAYTGLSEYVPKGAGTAPSRRLLPEIKGRWDTVIFDEAHYLKGRDTPKHPNIRVGLAKQISRRASRVYLATGTPIPNWSHELFTMLQLVYPDDASPGKPLGAYWNWAYQWFDAKPTIYDKWNLGTLKACSPACASRSAYDPCEHFYAFTEGNLRDRFLQRRRDDVLPDLPPLTELAISTAMGPKQRRAYASMKKDYIAQVEDKTVIAWSSGSRHVRLDRLCAGLEVIDDETALGALNDDRHIWAKKDNGKLLRLEEDLRNRSRPTIVMAHHQTIVEACAAVAAKVGLRVGIVHGGIASGRRGRAVRDFQSGQLDVLCGSLETLAEGLNLTQADELIFVEQSFKPSRNQQAMRRIHRLGQERPCTILDYQTPDSIDLNKRKLLATKTDQQIRTLTAAQVKQLL